MKNKLVILQINEVNFDLVKKYISLGHLKNFQFFIEKFNFIETDSESKHENLEPWIQWVSFYSGKSYDEHKVSHLNEFDKDQWNFFIDLEKKYKKKLALLFPMNLKNVFTEETFFIPDPWTETKINADIITKKIFFIFKKIILENASNKIKLLDYLTILLFCIFKTSFKFKVFLLKNLNKIAKYKFFKAIIFDRLCWEIYLKSSKVKDSDISSLFLNACAHVQHHYFLNSKAKSFKSSNPSWYMSGIDPIFECLKSYDEMLGEFKKLKNIDFIMLTGLSQSVIEEPIFYYNLKKPEVFFKTINVNYSKIIKRMSRDYTLEFQSAEEASKAYNHLINLKLNSLNFFNIKKETNKIFLELSYCKEIKDEDILLTLNNDKIEIKRELNFIAIKNSIHNSKGYLISSIKDYNKKMNINEISGVILKQYEI
tara:strand:- start:2729 stop:4006 length:1278 start_codon:yes stop_codon:yes gene_type:complete